MSAGHNSADWVVVRALEHLRGAQTSDDLDAAQRAIAADLSMALAPWCAIDLTAADDRFAKLAVCAHRDPKARGQLEQLRDGFTLDLRERWPAGNVTAPLRSSAGPYAPIAGALGWGDHCTIPIVVAGDPVGALTIATDAEEEPGSADVASLEAGTLAQAAIDRAAAVAVSLGFALGCVRGAADRDELLAVVSHDLRNPLGVLLLVSDFLRGEILPSAIKPQLERVERATRGIERIVAELSDVGRLAAREATLDCSVVDGAEIVAARCDEAQSAADDKQVTILRGGALATPGAARVPVVADRARISRAVSLLLAGAIGRTPRTGQISVTVEQSGRQAVFRIADGVVIRSSAGTGAIAGASAVQRPRRRVGALAWLVLQSVVTAHGGALWLESGDHGGTVASFSLPLAA